MPTTGCGSKEPNTSGAKPQELKIIRPILPFLIPWSKSIYLEKGFSIGLSDSKDRELTGFGMWVKTNEDGHSWDWFTRSEGDVFRKLQEGGSVRVKTRGAPQVQEIGEVEFLADISLRLYKSGKVGEITHRVTIKKGSVLSVLP